MNSKLNIISGGIYIILGMAFLAIGIIGASYLLDPADASRPFLKDDKGMITKHEAGTAMVPLGLLAGLGLAGFGGRRIKTPEEG